MGIRWDRVPGREEPPPAGGGPSGIPTESVGSTRLEAVAEPHEKDRVERVRSVDLVDHSEALGVVERRLVEFRAVRILEDRRVRDALESVERGAGRGRELVEPADQAADVLTTGEV